MQYWKNAYVIDKEALEELISEKVRYVVVQDEVLKQFYIDVPARLIGADGYIVVGRDERNRCLIAEADLWDEVYRKRRQMLGLL